MSVTSGASLKLPTVITLIIVLCGVAAAWGGNRMTIAGNSTAVDAVKVKHKEDINKIQAGQEASKDKLNEVRTEQRLIKKDIENIKDGQERQEDLSKQILQILKE